MRAGISFWQAMPKADLHLHFEGAIPRSFFAESPEGHLKPAQSFDDLVRAIRLRAAKLDSPQVISAAATAMAESLIADAVVLAEIHVSAGPLERRGGVPVPDVLRAVANGLHPYHDRLRTGIILDLVRHDGTLRAAEVFDHAMRVADEVPLVAVGLAGYERPGDVPAFSDLFARARSAGIGTVAHAGEHRGADGVREVLDHLKPSRIGHGTSAASDSLLVARLRDEGIPLEVCLTSNVATSVTRDASCHPLRRFLEEQLPVVLSTDDPALLGTSLPQEYALAEAIGCERNTLLGVARRAFDVSFLDEQSRTKAIAEIDSFLDREGTDGR